MLSSSTFISWLLSLCVIQFLVIVNLLEKDGCEIVTQRSQPRTIVAEPRASPPVAHNTIDSDKCMYAATAMNSSLGGVAATLMLHAPTWFQRRYTLMIQNAVNNIPDDWKVQVFHTRRGQSQKGLDINPGIRRFVDSGRVVLTEIPDRVLVHKKKRFEIMMEPWLWESMLAEKVLIFGGNAVICSNSPQSVANFTQFDYIGAPWDLKRGVGGDGGISVRSRSAMLAALRHRLDVLPPEERPTAHRKWGQEDAFFVSTLLEMQSSGRFAGRLAAREDTLRFAAIGSAAGEAVWAVSGTLPWLPFEARGDLMSRCPEMKIFYPALHDPSCFGAQPDGERCAQTVCALQPKTQRRGGC